MENGSIPGYQFLCEVLGSMYVPSPQKNTLMIRSQNESPMEKEEIKAIQADFVQLAYEIKTRRSELWQKLDGLLGTYYKDISTYDFFVDAESTFNKNGTHSKSLDSMFKSLLRDQVGTSNVSFAGIAITVVLAVGYSQNPNFYIGGYEVRTILTKSMESLGYHNADFIPDTCFEIKNGCADEDLLYLLLLTLLGALKVKYPHKKSEAQSVRNKEKARETIDCLVNSNQNSVLYGALRGSNEMSRICQGMVNAQKDDAQQVCFPNGKTISLERFYRIPHFEIIGNGTDEILRCDYNFCIRSLVVGKMGSGKTLLTKAIVRTCLDSAEARADIYSEYAKVLGLGNKSYLPLVLNCKELSRGEDLASIDLIEEAVKQLVRLTRTSIHASCLSHWNDFAPQVVEYYRRKARSSSLILIIEDISWLDRKSSESLLKKLREMERAEYSRLHILVATQRLINSQMMHFVNYNRVEIAALTFSLDEEISNLVNLGVGMTQTEDYLDLLKNNRHIRAFVDSPEHLVKLLCHPYGEMFDLDALLWQTIDEHIEGHFSSNVTDSDCREFLTALAVDVAESKKTARLSRHGLAIDHRSIPKNIVDKGYLVSLDKRISQPNVVWQHIMDNMVLVCPNSGINSYSFVNPMFYCSLVADYYLQLVGTQPTPNWLDRFNRLSAEDFSSILVLFFNRLCRDSSEDMAPNEVSTYDILILLQSVVGYIISRTEPVELFHCLLALQDLLSNKQLCISLQPNMHRMLEQVYLHSYNSFMMLSDDVVKKARLMKPDYTSC